MTKFRLFVALTLVLLAGAAAQGGVIVASNFPTSFQYSGYRTDIGYWSNTNNHPTNTAASQKFVPNQSGMLSTLTVYGEKGVTGIPLHVSLYSDQAGYPGTLLGDRTFSAFPADYFPPNASTALDLSPLGIKLAAGTPYHVVFHTDSAVYQNYYYSLHVLNPQSHSFGYGYCWSPNGMASWRPPSSREIALQVAVRAPLREIAPSLDAKADFSNGTSTVTDGDLSVNVQRAAIANVDRRGVLEFYVGQIPDTATVSSATLELDIVTITQSSSFPSLSLYGYAGNGTLELADGQITANLVGQSGLISDLGKITINLDTAYIQSLLSTSNYLGLLVLGDENGKQAAFRTVEGARLGSGFAPKLTIEYVPEPGTLVLTAIAGVASLVWQAARRPRAKPIGRAAAI